MNSIETEKINDQCLERIVKNVSLEGGVVEVAIAAPNGSAFNMSFYIANFTVEFIKRFLKYFFNSNIAYLTGIHDCTFTPTDINQKKINLISRKDIAYRVIHKKNFILDADLKDCFGRDLRDELNTEERKRYILDFIEQYPELKKFISLVLFSGNGAHIYFELETTFVGTPEEWTTFYEDCKYYIEAVICNNKIRFDKSTTNIARLMRAPLSVNRKKAKLPIQTEFIFFNTAPEQISGKLFEPSLKRNPPGKTKNSKLLPNKNSAIPKTSGCPVEEERYFRCSNFIELIYQLAKGIGKRNNSAFILINHLVAQAIPAPLLYMKLFYELLDQPANDVFDFAEMEIIYDRCIDAKRSENKEQHPKSPLVEDQWIYNDDGERISIKRHRLSWHLIAQIFLKWTTRGGVTKLAYFNSNFYQYENDIYVEKDELFIKKLISNFLHEYHEIFFILTGRNFIGELFSQVQIELNLKTTLTPPLLIAGGEVTELNIIPLKNGYIKIEEIHNFPKIPLYPYKHQIFILSKLPFDFSPYKTSQAFIDFLSTSVPDNDVQLVLQEYLGLSLTRDMSFEKFLVLLGDGANGKGVLLYLLQLSVGDNNSSTISIDSLDPKNTFNLTELYGKTINIDSDCNKFNSSSEGTFKKAVSGEPLTANQKFKPFLTFRPFAKWVIAANHMPNFSDNSDGTARRTIVAPFRQQIPIEKQNPELKTDAYWLRDNEIAGFFNWAICGYVRLKQNKQFSKSAAIEAELESFRNKQSPLREFALDTFEEAPNTSYLNTNEAYNLYVQFCLANGVAYKLPKSTFTTELKMVFKRMGQCENAISSFYNSKPVRDRCYFGIKRKIKHTQHTENVLELKVPSENNHHNLENTSMGSD